MARNATGLTLGFVGAGEGDPDNVLPLIENIVDAAEGPTMIFPVTADLFTDTIFAVANWAYEREIPYEVVYDEDAAKDKDLKDWIDSATKSHKVVKVATKIVGLLEKAPNPALVVAWDDEDGVSEDTALLAQEKNVKILDLLQGLDEIELQTGEPAAEGGDTPDAGDDTSGGDDESEFEPYTREELEAIDDIEELKKICTDNEIEVAPRSRKATYIQAILDAQGEAEEGGEGPDEGGDTGEAQEEQQEAQVGALSGTTTGEVVLLSDEDWDGLRDMAEGIVADVVSAVSGEIAVVLAGLKTLTDKMGTLGVNVDRALQQGTFAPAGTLAPVEQTAPATRPAKKAAPVTKAAPKAPPSNGGMTEAQAQKIVDEWGGRRGRPTAEVAEARRVLGLDQPQPKRPVGRPRKQA